MSDTQMKRWKLNCERCGGDHWRQNCPEIHRKWCVCVFCSAEGDFEARLDAVSGGWRTMKRKWICPSCMDSIRRAVQQGVS